MTGALLRQRREGKPQMNFDRYVQFKREQHARLMLRARAYRSNGRINADYLATARAVRLSLASDLTIHRKLKCSFVVKPYMWRGTLNGV
jgi:hypothetical protein